MKSQPLGLILLLLVCSGFNHLLAQDSTSLYNKVFSFPDKLFGSIDHTSSRFQDKLAHQTEHYLQKLARQEKKLQRKLAKKDSAAAARLFNGADSQYLALQKGVQKTSALTGKATHFYSSHLDSLTTALGFLQQKKLLGSASGTASQAQATLSHLGEVQNKLDQTAYVQKYLQQRQQYLQEQLGKFGLGQELRHYKETVYYYRAQMDAYKKTWENPSEVEAKAMNLLAQTSVFRNFFNKHSQLAGLFRLPGTGDGLLTAAANNGLQTRDGVQQELEQRFGNKASVEQIMQQNVASAQSQLSQQKDKLSQLVNKGGVDPNMPDFKPNGQKTKSFLKRLETGINVQSTRSNYFFPVTTDLGLSLGYKITDKALRALA